MIKPQQQTEDFNMASFAAALGIESQTLSMDTVPPRTLNPKIRNFTTSQLQKAPS